MKKKGGITGLRGKDLRMIMKADVSSEIRWKQKKGEDNTKSEIKETCVSEREREEMENEGGEKYETEIKC